MSLTNPTTSVPAPSLNETGFIAPAEQDILTGRQADFNMALGGNASTALNTPQGQIALSDTAVLGDTYAAMLAVFNGVDPATASGRMQEAIGRIYFMERRPATSTTVTAQATVTVAGQTLNAGTVVASATSGMKYELVSDTTLPASTDVNVSLELACTTAGAIPCPANSLQLYQGGLGIASLTNPAPGLMGEDAETRADFETRRRASVAANSVGQNASLMGALLSLSNVSDAYVVDNQTNAAGTIGGVTIPAHTLYILVEGGRASDIGAAILAKKPPGIPTMGTRQISVRDTNPVYDGVGPTYTFRYDRPTAVAVTVNITLEQSTAVPSDALQQVQNAVMGVVKTGRYRARMGGTVYASRLSAAVDALGDWAEVLSLTLSTSEAAEQNRIRLPINQLPTITPDTIHLELV